MPLLQQVGQLRRSADENLSVAEVFGTGKVVEPASSRLRRQECVEEHHQVTEDVHRVLASTDGPLQRADLGRDVCGLRGVVGGDESDVGAVGDQLVGPPPWPKAATIGWPCGGRGVIEGPLTENQRPSKSM